MRKELEELSHDISRIGDDGYVHAADIKRILTKIVQKLDQAMPLDVSDDD